MFSVKRFDEQLYWLFHSQEHDLFSRDILVKINKQLNKKTTKDKKQKIKQNKQKLGTSLDLQYITI